VAGAVVPISTATGKAGRPIDIRSFGSFIDADTPIAVTPNGKTVYVSARGGIVPISTATNKAGHLIDSPAGLTPPSDLVMGPGGSILYALGYGPKAHVVPIRTATNTEGKAVQVGNGTGASMLAITPDGTTAVATSITGVTLIDTASGRVRQIALHDAQGVAVTPTGATAYVVDLNNTVVPIQTATGVAGTPVRVARYTGYMIAIAPGR